LASVFENKNFPSLVRCLLRLVVWVIGLPDVNGALTKKQDTTPLRNLIGDTLQAAAVVTFQEQACILRLSSSVQISDIGSIATAESGVNRLKTVMNFQFCCKQAQY